MVDIPTQIDEERKAKTVNHLLNIDKFSGQQEGRLAPFLITAAISLLPLPFVLRIYVWLAGLFFNPKLAIIIIVVVYILYIIRIGLIFIGKERERVATYRRRMYSRYEELAEYVKIKNIDSKTGCIEYYNGMIAYMVVALNGNMETYNKFNRIQSFLEATHGYKHDILVQNTADSSVIDELYNKIKRFEDKEVANDYLAILDHNKQYITDKSLVVRTVYVFYGRATERYQLYDVLKSALPVKAYYDVHLASREEVLAVLEHDCQLYVDIDSLLVERFGKEEYYTSQVISYDRPENKREIKKDGRGMTVRGFIPKMRGDNK